MTQSVEDFLAPTLVQQAEAKASRKKPDQVSFTNSCESYAWYDQNSLSWRTWQRSLITDWELFSESFPKQGTMRNGQLYRQVHWEPVTKEVVGGSLPTPTATEYKAGYKEVFHENGKFFRRNLKGVKWGVRLGDAVKLLPTPTANEHKYSMSKEDHQSGTCLAAMARKDRLSVPTGKPMSLNPAFVEEMMGYPIGHTDLKH